MKVAKDKRRRERKKKQAMAVQLEVEQQLPSYIVEMWCAGEHLPGTPGVTSTIYAVQWYAGK